MKVSEEKEKIGKRRLRNSRLDQLESYLFDLSSTFLSELLPESSISKEDPPPQLDGGEVSDLGMQGKRGRVSFKEGEGRKDRAHVEVC